MTERLEGHFWGYQDAELFFQMWRPEKVRGTLVLTHGLGEHSERYNSVANEMADIGWQTLAWDLRGHGRSEGKRGYVNRFQDYCDDLESFLRFVKSHHHDRTNPIVLFGHSMGGLITLKMLLNHNPQNVNGVVLSSPALGVSLEVPYLKVKGAELLAKWAPKVTLFNEIDYTILSRDRALTSQYGKDPLRHDKVSSRLFLGMREAFEEMMNQAQDFHWPMLLQLAGQEKVVSTPASKDFFEKVGAKKKDLVIYADSYHEIYNDLDKADVIRDLKSFLERMTKS
jgi:alpha-beta hydrolase superfamily lysophospholipase